MLQALTLRRLSTAIATVAVATLSAVAPRLSAVQSASDAQPFEQAITSFMNDAGAVGLSVAVVRDGRTVLAKGYGRRAVDDAAAVSAETMFGIGSVTKQFTSAAILLLAEDGKLSTSDTVSKYYSGLPNGDTVTLLDLMNHVSGYHDFYPLDFVDRRMQKAIEVDSVIKEYARQVDFQPGTRWSYSNTGFDILGRVVERVSGDEFGAFLKRRIFTPLGMTHTQYEPDARGPAYATGFMSFALGPPERAVPEAKGWAAAAGALYSTATDLATWDLALVGGKVLKPASYTLMTTARILADGRSSGYGGGVSISTRNGAQVLSHGGAVSGFSSSNAVVPSTKSAVIVLSNYEIAGAGTLGGRLLDVMLGKQTSAPSAPSSPAPTAPAIAGPDARDQSLDVFHQLQAGKVDRARLGEEFSVFLTDARIAGASARLKPLGEPAKIEILSRTERGGMEVSRGRLTFASVTLRTLMYRTPDGKVQQFFVDKS